MKVLIALILFISPAAFAAPYIEYKNSWNIPERKDVHNLRLGYKTEKNFYGEIGPRSNGYAAETGYKIKKLVKFHSRIPNFWGNQGSGWEGDVRRRAASGSLDFDSS